MELKDFLGGYVEKANNIVQSQKLRFFLPTSTDKIVKLYDTYNGSKRKMHPLNADRVNEYLEKGFAFVGAKYDDELIGITVSREFPTDYPYFTLPYHEQKGAVYTLGGLYVRPDFQGKGIAGKLSHIAINGTEDFGRQTGKAVGIGYEVSYDNKKSLKTLIQQGNYIGYYYDKNHQEGLSLLLYRPFHHDPISMRSLKINLNKNETSSLRNLNHALTYMGAQKHVGGTTRIVQPLEDGNVVTTRVVNSTVDTITKPVFHFEK